MKTFSFEVYETRHKTVSIEAKSLEEAEEKFLSMLYDVDMDDAEPIWDDREWNYVETEDAI